MKKAVELYALNVFSYVMLTWDYRAVAQANYPQAIFVNLVIAAMSFSILKRIQDAVTISERIAYILSGGTGVALGIWVSKMALGQ